MVRHLAALNGLLRLTLYEQHVFVPLYHQRGSSLLSQYHIHLLNIPNSKMTQMTHHPNQQTPEADRCRGVDRSLLEFLKPKAVTASWKPTATCFRKHPQEPISLLEPMEPSSCYPVSLLPPFPNLPVSGNGSVPRFASLSPDSPNLVSFP